MKLVDIKNAKGSIYYGMHFYPGVAQYDDTKGSTTIYLNEDALRKMDPTFAGKPVFVEHVDGVDENVDEVRKEADGWVIESFFNSADGKHWVKFIVVSSRGEEAVKKGFRLSNAYHPSKGGAGGLWNGVAYQEEILDGDYEHLAIVNNPRYDESVIMTPDQFKRYNEGKEQELRRIANSKEKENTTMKLKFFKKTSIEKSDDLETTSVVLPKSGKEMTVAQIVNAMDEVEEKKKENMADPEAKVKMHDGKMCNVGELVAAHKALHDELATMKADNGGESELAVEEKPVDVEGDKHNDDEDKDKDEKKENLAEEDEKEVEEKKKENELKTKAERKKHFDTLKNAHLKAGKEEEEVYMTPKARVDLGKQRYGSN